MNDNDSIITDFSVLDTPQPFRQLPKSTESSLNTDDFTSSSSDAVIRALQTLQQKITKLELERKEAEKKFGSLEKETCLYKDLVNKVNKENVMYPLEPTSTPSNKSVDTAGVRSVYTAGDVSEKLDYHQPQPPPVVQLLTSKSRALYCPSSSQPYATYVRPGKERSTEEQCALTSSTKKLHDSARTTVSRVSILEKQLEYMRRLVHTAEQERNKATERMCFIEQEKENQDGRSTHAELERQNTKIAELEKECYKLNTAHSLAEGKISELESNLQTERDNHEKLLQQTEQLARVTEENKKLVLSMTPSLPPSPDAPIEKKKKRKRRSSTGSPLPHCAPGYTALSLPPPPDWRTAMPFVCGRSAHPSHSLTANVQQMLSALKQENPALCARVTTQRRKRGSGNTGKEIKQVVSGLEDDLGALTFEYQKLAGTPEHSDAETQKKLNHISEQMEKKTAQIKKLKSCLKKLVSESRVVRTQAVPTSRPFSTLSNREVEICMRGSNTRELLAKVKSIRDVLTNKDIQWV